MLTTARHQKLCYVLKVHHEYIIALVLSNLPRLGSTKREKELAKRGRWKWAKAVILTRSPWPLTRPWGPSWSSLFTLQHLPQCGSCRLTVAPSTPSDPRLQTHQELHQSSFHTCSSFHRFPHQVPSLVSPSAARQAWIIKFPCKLQHGYPHQCSKQSRHPLLLCSSLALQASAS